ncbi:hypothetical protein BX666DRAFT_1253005 [Dichotomocladium elegans]|nr:hypothetical protein BX666DRAFT_1253005 [Dichotomocladium elegans]
MFTSYSTFLIHGHFINWHFFLSFLLFVLMFKILTQKKKRSSSVELLPPSSKAYFDARDQAPVRVAKKEIPQNRGETPVLAMPKPKYANPPTEAVLSCYDHDKTEIEEMDNLGAQKEDPQSKSNPQEEKKTETMMIAEEYVRVLQQQVVLIQRQCELERAEWQKREEEHKKREQEMMETIYKAQDQLRLVAYYSSQKKTWQRPHSMMSAEEEYDDADDDYPVWQYLRLQPTRSRRNSASSFKDHHDPFLGYHDDLSDPFLGRFPIVRQSGSRSSTPHQHYQHQRRRTSTFYNAYGLV